MFNELNSVEHFIVHRLSGVNLNSGEVREPAAVYGPAWEYVAPENLGREQNEVLLVEELKAALVRLNPEIAAQPELADEVIYKLRAIILGVRTDGLVKANEEFHRWLVGDRTMPFGEHNRHVPVRLIDFDDVSANRYVVTNQLPSGSRRRRFRMWCSSSTVCLWWSGKRRRPFVRPSPGSTEPQRSMRCMRMRWRSSLCQHPVVCHGRKQLYYGGVRCPLEHWAPWRMENDP